jgi:transcriptional regulator with XRE-family HTH domain
MGATLATQQYPNRLKEFRLSKGLSQEQFALKLGVSHRTYQDWEQGRTGKFPVEVLGRLKTLGADLNWLLTGDRYVPRPDDHLEVSGQAIIRLPRGDPEPLSDDHADLLEKAVVVLRAEGSAEHYAVSLAANIDSSYKGVLQARLLEGPAGLKAANGDS